MTRSILVTGGNRGIGLAVAQAFAEQGDRVAVTHRGSGVPDGLLGLTCDVTDPGQIDKAVTAAEEAHGPLDVVVANAGVTDDRLILRMSDSDFGRVLDTNLGGAFRVARRAVETMVGRRRGRLVFISSVAGLRGSAGQANYASSKAGLVGLARSLARELGPRGITANVVAPGLVDTDMTEALSARQRDRILQDVPLGRSARPSEVASAVLWLGSEQAGYVTGAVLPVDGGLGMGH
ncbi:3-oxoacyl-ACP reductase FabG [Streptomyces sp. URMC 128]|uniref:3-oxoacyl-ACP reductase FabG n=1 Tax=Streptomyces sp. URMC 128 TaxID=3423404 RepID=UPI003F1A1397